MCEAHKFLTFILNNKYKDHSNTVSLQVQVWENSADGQNPGF